MDIMFGTQQWLDHFVNKLNADPKYQQVARNYEGTIIFRCLAEPGLHEQLDQDLRFYFDPYHGNIREYRLLEPSEPDDAQYEISGKYKDWKLAARGKLNLRKAIVLTRQFKVKGKISELIKHLAAGERIFQVMADMQNEFVFPDEAAA